MEAQSAVDVGIGSLLHRQLDVEADRETAGLRRAAVGRLHQARAAAGDDAEAVVDETGRGLAGELIPGVGLRHPGGAEDRDAVVDVAESVEAALDLGPDPFQPQLVLFGDVAGDAEQVLVALRPHAPVWTGQSAPGGIRTRAARLKRPPL